MVLEKTLESPLDYKEIQPVHQLEFLADSKKLLKLGGWLVLTLSLLWVDYI